MSLVEHLVELRKRILAATIMILIASAAGWMLTEWIWDVLREPLLELQAEGRQVAIQYTDVSSGFDTKMKLALFLGVLMSSPGWLYQIWAYLAPALAKKEKRYAIGVAVAGAPLFLAGVYVGWRLLPNIVRLLSSFQPHEDAFLMDARLYLDFTVKLTLAVGVGFVLPVFLVLLNFIGILSGRSIIRSWRMAVIAIVLFAAITTPGADLMSMFLLAIPITLLFFIAAGIAIWHDRARNKRLERELASIDSDEPNTHKHNAI